MPLMKPAFLADYRNARRVRPPIAFTRNSLQSYAGPLGVLAQVAANEPAITFDAATLACLGTPNEQQSTNVLLRSNAFSTSPWDTLVLGTGTAPTLTPNAGVAPDGTATAWRLQCNIGAGTTTGDQSRIFQDVSGLASPHDLTPSIWIKSNTGVNQSVYFRNVTGVGGSTVTATPEWRRVWIPNAAVATTTESIQIGCRGTHSQGSIDVLIWEAQMELGLMPTSNVHTDGSTVTRAATSQIISGSEFTSRY
ncbi:hypothetical protein ABXN37_27220, partial [Piscinibacter sakaiensis]|uniref:phage head spike fiber domain-containing protein n=1 Tax=Piscinibacter sakaiensis TaxID=1547922 RepID=UPI0018D02827